MRKILQHVDAMPRPPRLVLPGYPLHLIQRGNDRSATFRVDEDYVVFRNALLVASRRVGCAIHAYVFMTNHVHLLVTPADEQGPAEMMQSVGRRYVRYFNERYRRTGTLWEGRYRSSLVESDGYLLACSRYIELNPVRAGIVTDPCRYRWSSYRHNAWGDPDDLVTPHAVYRALGTHGLQRRAAYRRLCQTVPEPGATDTIRNATRLGLVLGNQWFQRQIEVIVERRLGRLRHGGDRRSEQFLRGRAA